MNEIDMAWDELAKGIVLQSVIDYKQYYKTVMKYKVNTYSVIVARERINEIKRFFFSDWFAALCNIDPNILLNHIEKECRNEEAKRIIRKQKKNL